MDEFAIMLKSFSLQLILMLEQFGQFYKALEDIAILALGVYATTEAVGMGYSLYVVRKFARDEVTREKAMEDVGKLRSIPFTAAHRSRLGAKAIDNVAFLKGLGPDEYKEFRSKFRFIFG